MSDIPRTLSRQPTQSYRNRWLLLIALTLIIGGYYYFVSLRPRGPTTIEWVTNMDAGLAKARETNRPIFIDFHADWCKPCQWMDEEVFSRKDVAAALGKWVPISIDVDHQSTLAARYQVEAMPTFVILSPQGNLVQRHEDGTLPPEQFIAFIANAEKKIAASKPAG